jgi:chemotaxis protein CheX
MDVAYVNPFIRAAVDTFKTMLGCELKIGKPELKNDAVHSYDISGVIGLSGEAQGVISMSFPEDVAMKVVSLLIQTPVTEVNADVTDGIGEIANIVAGNAKQYLVEFALTLSLPNVVVGKGHRIAVQRDVKTIVLPLTSEHGEFAMEVALKTN